MAFTTITPSNSRTAGIVDHDFHATLFVAESAYITPYFEGEACYFADGGAATVIVYGALSGDEAVAVYVGSTEQQAANAYGDNRVTIGISGIVQGDTAIVALGNANVITNHGLVLGTGTSDSDFAPRPGGIYMQSDRSVVSNDGLISGICGIYVKGDATRINNSGTIATTGSLAIHTDRSLTLNNSGNITGNIDVGTGATIANTGTIDGSISCYIHSQVQNHGLITGSLSIGGDLDDAFTNDGTIGDVIMGGGFDEVFNQSGAIMGTITFSGAGDTDGDTVINAGTVRAITFDSGVAPDTLTNTGIVLGDVDMGGGYNDVFNHGAIHGELDTGLLGDMIMNSGRIGAIYDAGGRGNVTTNAVGGFIGSIYCNGYGARDSYTVVNDGIIGIGVGDTAITTGGGQGRLTNTGTIYGGIDMGGGGTAIADTIENHGLIAGDVVTREGDDVVNTALGQIDGLVDMGTGNDMYVGGAATDRVIGGVGIDTIDLAGGDDVYRAIDRDGNDELDGGEGTDTYDGSALIRAFSVDLSAGTTGGRVGSDAVAGFENAVGGVGNDSLIGSEGNNRLEGGAGADTIDGGAGADRLFGGAGTDRITGGSGRDVMSGGRDSDTFVFTAGATGPTPANRDVITDFTDHGGASGPFARFADTIDLRAVDAVATQGGNQAFSFNATEGATFSGAAGSLIWEQRDGYALVSADTDGDGRADFSIQLRGTHILFASDFVL